MCVKKVCQKSLATDQVKNEFILLGNLAPEIDAAKCIKLQGNARGPARMVAQTSLDENYRLSNK